MHKQLKQLIGLGLALAVGVVAWANSLPVLDVTVNGGVSDLTLPSGTTATIGGRALDSDGDMSEHWLEIQSPDGVWSWQGWLTGEPWAGALGGDGSISKKSGSFTFKDLGTYTVRTTAIDSAQEWMISPVVHVTVTMTVPSAGDNGNNPVASPPLETPPIETPPVATSPVGDPPLTGSGPIFRFDGSIDPVAYGAYYKAWDAASVSARLGPTFESLNPGKAEDRPTNFMPGVFTNHASYIRVDPYNIGPPTGSYPDNDYWSESGQVAYIPDDPSSDPGIDRVQVFAYYDHVFAVSPRLDYASNPAHPEPQTLEWEYQTLFGRLPKQPVAMVRGVSLVQNEAIVVYREGLIGVVGTQTSRDGSFERPYPGTILPANKVPTGIAITSSNEFALVSVWDTTTQRGQIAVIALEGKFISYHTWPYMALPNQGSWSDMKILGYLDLPMAAPSSISAASNGWWDGPSQTAGLDFGQIDLTNPWTRDGMLNGDPQWSMVVASKGYAIVASKMENKVAIVDLTPLFEYARQSYLSSSASYWKTVSTRGSGPGQWPLTFAEKPEIMPKIIWQGSYASPTVVLAGPHIDRWSEDRQKAYIACEDGTIHILDTSPLMARFSWETMGTLSEMGSFKVGRNPASMAFMRHPDSNAPLIPTGKNGIPGSVDPLNNAFYVACRGDREVDGVVTFGGKGVVYRRLRDTRMGDPVGVSVALRGNIVSVTDFNGRKLVSYRIGAVVDRAGRVYGAGASGNSDFDFAGQLTFSGYPFLVNTVNVN